MAPSAEDVYNPSMACTLDDILQSHLTGRPIVMGVVNVTPDSFSDGGKFLDPADARAQARALLDQGADVLDLGAESTRPGSDRVSAGDQIARLREILPPVCNAAAEAGALVSIDTTRASVAQFALDAGATIVNDIAAGRDDPEILAVTARAGAVYILMHMLGQPATMQADPTYTNVTAEVRDFLEQRLAAAAAAGVPRERCVVDPGIGFGKTTQHNLELLAGMAVFRQLSCPVLVGPSRKRFIGELTGRSEPADRVAGTIGACLSAYERGATIFRVHDVAAVRDALTIAAAVRSPD